MAKKTAADKSTTETKLTDKKSSEMKTSEAKTELSFGAQLFPAAKKVYAEPILIVPFYGGKKKQVRRHAEYFNELGFDAIVFEFNTSLLNLPNRVFSATGGFGFKSVWADQIEQLLNEIQGNKIIYAMSNPSSGAIEAIARRHAYDINGLICDGGPTGRYWNSLVKYFTSEIPLPIAPARWAAATLLTPLWSPDPSQTLHKDLNTFPDQFKLLSVRGWKDHLITPKFIDEVFEPHSNLDWRKLSLPEGGHLDGLKDFAGEYKPTVEAFLKEISTAL